MVDQFLQLLNIGLTSGVLLLLIGAAVKYGKLQERVDSHSEAITNLWQNHNRLEDKLFEREK